MTLDADLEKACKAAWMENCAIYTETNPQQPPLSKGWDEEPEALRAMWRRIMRAAFAAIVVQ